MRPAVLTAVLLLVDILNTEANQHDAFGFRSRCAEYRSCGGGWTHAPQNRCMKYIDMPETFSSAQIVCRLIHHGELMSKPNQKEIDFIFCSRWEFHAKPLWVVDTAAAPNTCTELTFEIPHQGYHVVNCSQKKVFFCVKNK